MPLKVIGNIIYTFMARNSGDWENINVTFDAATEQISAFSSNGGFPQIAYFEYDPNIPDGETIAIIRYGSKKYTIRFQSGFPFAYYEVETVTPIVDTLTVSVVKTDETAPNEKDGTATVTVTGGTHSYEYSLNNVDWQSSNLFEDLPFGSYIVYVKDAATGLGQASFEIVQGAYPPLPPVLFPDKDVTCLSDGELNRGGGYKRTIVKTNFGSTPATLYNGDFEGYDGQNWEQWDKYGGINVSRGQRKVKDNNGNDVPISNYTLVFNEKANSGKWIQHSVLPVKKGDTARFSINIGTTLGTGNTTGSITASNGWVIPARYRSTYELRIRISIGNYYLYNADGGTNFQWVNQLAVITSRIDNSSGDVSSYLFNFSIPEFPVTGSIYIQLFGFVRVLETSTDEFKYNAVLPAFPATYKKEELSEYTPVEVDDIKFELSSQNRDNDINGIVNISDNLDYFTKPLEQIDILFGDLRAEDEVKPENEKLWGIYDQDGKPTKEWVEYGISTKNTTLGMATARSIMQSFQASYYKFTGSLMLKKDARMFSYLDTFNFIVNMKQSGLPATDFNNIQFVMLGGDIDLKFRRLDNIEMREYFRRLARTSDVTIPVTNNTPLPPISNDPNSTENVDVFTEEFNETYI